MVTRTRWSSNYRPYGPESTFENRDQSAVSGVRVNIVDTRRSADAPKSQGAPDVPFGVPSLPEKAVICGVVICVLVLRRHLSKASQAVSRDASQAVSRDNCYLKAFLRCLLCSRRGAFTSA